MSTLGAVRDALSVGPLSAAAVIEKTGLDHQIALSALSHLYQHDQVTKDGNGLDAVYTLIPRPAKAAHEPAKRKAKPKTKEKAKKAPQRAPDVRAQASDFTVAITGDDRLVLIRDGVPQILPADETQAVVDFVLASFGGEA